VSVHEEAVFIDWITQTLVNDEASSDAELAKLFKDEGKMEQEEIAFVLRQRDEALRDPFNFKLDTSGLVF
jgi:hypothetical protein